VALVDKYLLYDMKTIEFRVQLNTVAPSCSPTSHQILTPQPPTTSKEEPSVRESERDRKRKREREKGREGERNSSPTERRLHRFAFLRHIGM
jgi:hypothetical protein